MRVCGIHAHHVFPHGQPGSPKRGTMASPSQLFLAISVEPIPEMIQRITETSPPFGPMVTPRSTAGEHRLIAVRFNAMGTDHGTHDIEMRIISRSFSRLRWRSHQRAEGKSLHDHGKRIFQSRTCRCNHPRRSHTCLRHVRPSGSEFCQCAAEASILENPHALDLSFLFSIFLISQATHGLHEAHPICQNPPSRDRADSGWHTPAWPFPVPYRCITAGRRATTYRSPTQSADLGVELEGSARSLFFPGCESRWLLAHHLLFTHPNDIVRRGTQPSNSRLKRCVWTS